MTAFTALTNAVLKKKLLPKKNRGNANHAIGANKTKQKQKEQPLPCPFRLRLGLPTQRTRGGNSNYSKQTTIY